MIPLRPYQAAGLAAVEAFVEAGGHTPLLAWATGLGKTILFAHWLRKRGGRGLVIAHRDELINQAVEKIGLVDDTVDVGIVKAERDEPDATIVVASIQTLSRSPQRLAAILAGGLESVVIDEAHHSEAESYQRTLRVLRCATTAPVLGVTATPARGDHKPLGRTWQKVVHSLSILQGIQQGYLCDLKAERVRLDVDLSQVHLVNDDFVSDELEHVLLDANMPEKVAQAVVLRAQGRKTLVFTPGVESAYQTAAALRQLGRQAAAVHGEVSIENRRLLLDQFASGKVDTICNCNVLTEGFDEPTVSCVVIARPTRSQPFYTQMVGRGTRCSPGKPDCLVLDCVDAAFAHELVTMAELFLPETGRAFAERLAAGVSVAEALAEVTEGTLHIETVPILRKNFAWVKAGPAWILGLGGRSWLQLIEISNRWRVEKATQEAGPVKLEVQWEGPTLEYAQGVAEDIMRQHGAERLMDLNAGWRRAPMSDAQRRALDRWGVPYNPRMRKGDAADLLTRLIAGKAAMQRRAT